MEFFEEGEYIVQCFDAIATGAFPRLRREMTFNWYSIGARPHGLRFSREEDEQCVSVRTTPSPLIGA